MIRLFRFSPARLALAYIALSVLVLALFAMPLWYAWRVNRSTFRAYVQGEDLQRLVEVFDREGAKGLATAMDAHMTLLPGDEIMVFADASKLRLAGNLPAWPAEIPDAPGTYGLVLGLGSGMTMRVVASHVRFPGGYHLLMGRESVRFESLVDRFWYGIASAIGIVVVLGAVLGWMIRRALLFEVHEISRTASAIVEGDFTRRVPAHGGSDELDTLARTVNGMLEQLARQNVQLEGEVAVRRQAEQALHLVQDDLEGLVVQRTAQLAQANESLRRSETYLAEAQRLSHTGSWACNVGTRQIVHGSQEYFRIFGFDPDQGMPSFATFRQRVHPDDQARAAAILESAVRERTDYELDCRIVLPDGAMRYIHAIGHPVFNASGDPVEFVGTVMDVTERQRAEEERQAHLLFLESMEKVNRAMQGTNDLEQMMSDVLDAVLSIFHCDRAWLVYPCDPEAASWKVPMEHAQPAFPGAFALGLDQPVDPDVANVFQTVRASSIPVRLGPGSEHPLPAEVAKRFSIQSMIAMALYPKGDKPYMLGLHQCSYPRVWMPQEERLLQEIGRRLEDALTSLLMLRNLRDSERKLEEAQRLTHVGYWERDPETDLITWSDETYRIFGLQPQAQSLNLAQLPELIHLEDKQIMVQAVAEALRGGRRYDVEYRVVRPNGEVRLVHSQGDVMRDESGRPRRMFGSVQDITERKRAEQRLVVQHTVTQILAGAATLPEATPKILQAVCECLVWDLGALWSLDRQAGVLRCVEMWHKESVEAPHFEATSRASTFLPGSGLPGRVWSSRAPAYIPDIVHDAHFPRAPIAAREGLHTACGFPILLGGDVLGVMEFFSHERRQPDQDLLHMMATIGSQIGQFIERKRAEEALRVSEASLAEGQQISRTGNWRWHIRTGEVRGSAEHARLFGFDPAAGPRSHRRYRERVHPDDRPGLVHVLDSAIRDQRAFQHEYRIVLPDGVVKHVQLAGRPDTDAAGALELAGTIMDITERKRAEEALQNAQAELARVARLTTLGELAASIAHEINQPLGAVVNNASACVRWLAAQNLEEARRSAALVVADGHRAGEIIGRIRALAKKAPPHKDWLDLNATIRDVLALARSEVHRHGVTLETHLATEVPRILGDRIQLQQVLLNLLMNAIEAMSGVSAGPRALWVSSEPVAATEVLIAVRDSGPGLDPQSLDRLFDTFYTTKAHGLGLGLAISRRIIEAHGGRLWATANAPHGAVLQFTVPIGSEGGA